MPRTPLAFLLLLLACGPVNTGSRVKPASPHSYVRGVCIYYYPAATALDKAQLDETVEEHLKLAGPWIGIHGATLSPKLCIRWYRGLLPHRQWRRRVTYPVHDHIWAASRGVTGSYVPSTNTLHIVASAKNTTTRDNTLAELLVHSAAGDWAHTHPCWLQHQGASLWLDVQLEAQR